MNDLIGSRIAGGNTAYKRKESDLYPTPSEVTQALINFLKLPKGTHVWEPACGNGNMVDVLKASGAIVTATDILTGSDFLTSNLPEGTEWIITNPPFSISEQFILKCAEHCVPFALLLKSQYWHAARRYELFKNIGPSYILPLTWRPDFLFKTRGAGSPLMDVIWCVWGFPQEKMLSSPLYIPLKKPLIKEADAND